MSSAPARSNFPTSRSSVEQRQFESVWRVVTEPDQISRWWTDSAEIELRPGGEGTLTWTNWATNQPAAIRLRVESIERPHLFSFWWLHPHDAEPRSGNAVLVVFTLSAEGERTRLRVSESGLRELDWADDQKAQYADEHCKGWDIRLGRLRDAGGMAECLIGLGAVTAAAGRAGEAVKLLEAGEAALQASGRRLWPSNQADHARWSAHARRALSPSAFARACREGQQWPLAQAVAWVSERGPAGATVPLRQPEEVARLTRREVEVAQLAAQGLTNRQIAEVLVITERTAANHLQHSLEKLGLHSRVQLAAAWRCT